MSDIKDGETVVYNKNKPKTGPEIVQKYELLEKEAVIKRLEAYKIARVTIPDLLPLGLNQNPLAADNMQDGSKLRALIDKPYSSIGPRCIRGLASQMFYVLFPPNGKYFDLKIPERLAHLFDDRQKAQQDEQLSKMALSITELMNQDQIDVILQQTLERVIVEGQTMIHVHKEGIRIIPFKNFVCKRCEGKLVYAIVCEYDQDGDEDAEKIFTYIDYETNEVFQFESDGERKKLIKDKAKQYIVATSRVHPYENFSYGFAYNYLGQLETVNYLKRSIEECAYLAGLIAVVVDAGASITPDQLAQFLNGGIYQGDVGPEGNVRGVGMLTAQSKISEMAWLNDYISKLESDLENDFALRLFDQSTPNAGPAKTATEVIRLNQDLERDVNSHVAVLRLTLQMPLVQAYMSILGYDKIVVRANKETNQLEVYREGPRENSNGEKLIEVAPISGVSVLTKQVQMAQIQDMLTWLAQNIGPQNTIQVVDYIGLSKHFCELLNLPTDIIFKPQQNDQPPPLAGQIQANQVPGQVPNAPQSSPQM